MKKKIIGVAVMAAIAITAGWNMSQSENVSIINIALDTTEALASGESGCVNGSQNTRYCFQDGGVNRCDSYWIWNCVTAIN